MFLLTIPLVTVAEDVHRRHSNAVQRAILRAYPSMQSACVDMDVSPANFSKELSGERTFRFTPLMNLNAAFWRWYPVVLALEFGMPTELETAARLGVLAKKMARMDGTTVGRRAGHGIR